MGSLADPLCLGLKGLLSAAVKRALTSKSTGLIHTARNHPVEFRIELTRLIKKINIHDNMVRPCLTVENQSKVLRWLATEIINTVHPEETVEDLLANPCLLHSYMLKTSVDWHWISNEVGVDEKKVSRWYYETHLRHILTIKMTNEDRGEIRKIIINWIRCQQVPDERLYQAIHEKYGKKYSRQELRMTYYNMLNSRCIRAVLSECNIQRPTRRRKLPETERTRLSSSTVLHIPGYASDPQPTSLDHRKLFQPDTHNYSPEAASFSQANSKAESGLDNDIPDEPVTFSPLAIQSITQQYPCVKLLNLQSVPLSLDINGQLACIPLIIVEPGANIWSITPNEEPVGGARQ